MRNQSAGALIIFFVVILVGIAGYIANIVKLIGLSMTTDPNIVMAILRAVGIFVAPLGIILGIFV